MSSADTTPDVLIVGAGLSGLVAAHRIRGQGASVRVLEARDRVGGRTLTVPLGAGLADLGGQWLSPTQERLAALAREFDVATHPQERTGETLLVRGEHRARTWLARIPGAHALELAYRMRRIERMAAAVPLDAPHRAARAEAWAQRSLGDWISSNVRTDKARESLRLLTALHLGVEVDEVSLLYFLHFLGATSGLTGAALDGQESRFIGGAQRLCERLARTLDDCIELGRAVTRIAHTEAAVEVARGPDIERARHAILALPPALIARLPVSPPWPVERARVHQAQTTAPVIKCALAYAEPFWTAAGLSGEAYHCHGLVRAVVDHSMADGSQPALMAFITGESARSVRELPASERRTRVIEAVAELFGDRARAVLDYVEKDWSQDPLSAGCVAVLGAGAPANWAVLRQPVGRVHFAGTETAVRWPHYLEGAVEAGQRAAEEVLTALRATARTPTGLLNP